jgi:hypothetical protein
MVVQMPPTLFDSNSLKTGVVGPYQNRDRRIIDYQQVVLGGHPFRGPLPQRMYSKEKLSFLGAAQTFGRFVRVPFPTILGSLFNLDVLNLGYAGAGASFYLSKPYVLSQAAGARAAVVQVMSGRSCANSVFDAPEGRNVLVRRSDGKVMTDGPGYRWVLETFGSDRAIAVVRETQARWVEETIALAKALPIPKVLFWFSVRETAFTPSGAGLTALMGEFPHFISSEMLAEVRPYFDGYAECVSRRGLPHPLRDRYTGEAVDVDFAGSVRSTNHYYPSAQMHLDAAVALDEPLRLVLAAR